MRLISANLGAPGAGYSDKPAFLLAAGPSRSQDFQISDLSASGCSVVEHSRVTGEMVVVTAPRAFSQSLLGFLTMSSPNMTDAERPLRKPGPFCPCFALSSVGEAGNGQPLSRWRGVAAGKTPGR